MRTDDAVNPIAVEIQQETAGAYFAACRKMVDALAALKAFDGEMRFTPENFDARQQLVDEAAERVYFVIIQREAMKLSWYDAFFDDYGVPHEVRTRLGVRRR